MKREDIEKAAVDNISCFSEISFEDILAGLGRDCFVYGAEWRINSIWHDASENPKDGFLILAFINEGLSLIAGPNNSGWETTIRELQIVKWAYIDDLLPVK